MKKSILSLFKQLQFRSIFIVQALGALNDNIFKNALVILITYTISVQQGFNPSMMVTASAGLFILPFFLFSATAGKLADYYDKARLIQWIKAGEILIMTLGVAGFYLQSVNLLLVALFLMGTQSTFFGPIKYGILPILLEKDELVSGNGLISAATFLAILLGTVIGGVLILNNNGVFIISGIVMTVAIGGWYTSLKMAPMPVMHQVKKKLNIVTDTRDILKSAFRFAVTRQTILGISWFWFIGAIFIAQFPVFAKNVIGGNEFVVTLFLTA